MDQFLNNLKRESEANPTTAMFATAAVLTSVSQLIKAIGAYKGSAGYHKYSKLAEKKAKEAATKQK